MRGSDSRVTYNQIHGAPTPVSDTTIIGPTLANGEGNYMGYNSADGFLTEGIRLHDATDSKVEHNKFTGSLGVGQSLAAGAAHEVQEDRQRQSRHYRP